LPLLLVLHFVKLPVVLVPFQVHAVDTIFLVVVGMIVAAFPLVVMDIAGHRDWNQERGA
jgi:hypothetical protein